MRIVWILIWSYPSFTIRTVLLEHEKAFVNTILSPNVSLRYFVFYCCMKERIVYIQIICMKTKITSQRGAHSVRWHM